MWFKECEIDTSVAMCFLKNNTRVCFDNSKNVKLTYRQLRARRVLLLFKRCSIENQKGAIAIDIVQR